MVTDTLAQVWIGLAVPIAVALLRVNAPYGRHARAGWGPEIPAWVGWMVMEAPAALVPLALALASGRTDPGSWLILSLLLVHYAHRAVVWPLRRRHDRTMPASVAAMAVGFNLVNGSLQGMSLFWDGPPRGYDALAHPTAQVGFVLFFVGAAVNVAADEALLRLRRQGGYALPRGRLFDRISCPNYAGEIVEWVGFALISGSWAGWSFAIWTAANLAPRAVAHHRWYQERFPDLPPTRTALIPGVL